LADVAVSIALAVKGRVVVGVVYNPFRNEMFHACVRRGAFLNDRRIAVSSAVSLDSALVVCEWGYERSPAGIDAMLAGVRRLMLSNVRGIRQIGSGALDMCYVACGRVEAVYTGLAGEGWKIWDYAAAGLIAEEAGARLSTIGGEPFALTAKSMACTAPGIAKDLIAALRP
jgi:myo-inositol-1(or 4)-monophosphatase